MIWWMGRTFGSHKCQIESDIPKSSSLSEVELRYRKQMDVLSSFRDRVVELDLI